MTRRARALLAEIRRANRPPIRGARPVLRPVVVPPPRTRADLEREAARTAEEHFRG